MNFQLIINGTLEEIQQVTDTLLSNGVKLGGEKASTSKSEKTIATGKGSGKKKEEDEDLDTDTDTDTDTTSETTIEELRELVQEKAQAGKRDKVKEILKKYGASKLTELEEKNFDAFKAAVNKIK